LPVRRADFKSAHFLWILVNMPFKALSGKEYGITVYIPKTDKITMGEKIFLLGILILAGFAPIMAGLSMVSEVSCAGECEVVHVMNGEKVKVVSDGDITVTAKADNGKSEINVEAKGSGTAIVDIGRSPSSMEVSGESRAIIQRANSAPESAVQAKTPQEGLLEEGGESLPNADEKKKAVWGDAIEIYSGGKEAPVPKNEEREIIIESNTDGHEEKLTLTGAFYKAYSFVRGFSLRVLVG
jgi:hypothetical protein